MADATKWQIDKHFTSNTQKATKGTEHWNRRLNPNLFLQIVTNYTKYKKNPKKKKKKGKKLPAWNLFAENLIVLLPPSASQKELH